MSWLITISYLLLVFYIIILLIYLYAWIRLSIFKKNKSCTNQTSISIIIPARDEVKNIQACLNAILRNNYPKDLFEIIVIDDFSTDNTAQLATEILVDGFGKVLSLKDYLSPEERINAFKKKALSIAIEQAKGQLIITTDADCIVPSNWLSLIVAQYEQTKAKCIVAPVSFIAPQKKNLLYYFQSLDFMMMQGITASGTKIGLGCMCNGANLAFEKKAFENVGGYSGIDQIASGDDMLLLNKIKTKFPGSIQYLKNTGAIVKTASQPSYKSFINQRIRWASKSDKYDDKLLTVILAFVYCFNLSLLLLFIMAFFNPFLWLILSNLLLFKIIIEAVFLIPVAQFYGKGNEMIIFPWLQPFHILYIVSVGFLGKFGHYQWKGRKVH